MAGTRQLIPAGASHPSVRRYLDLKAGRRGAAHELVLEGLWAVETAMSSGTVAVLAAFICPQLVRGDRTWKVVDDLHRRGVPCFAVSERLCRRMADRDGPDGVFAIGQLHQPSLASLTLAERTRVLVADAVELAGNLGTVVRCADGAGAAGVLVTERRLRLTHPLVLKASMGAAFHRPVIETSRDAALTWLRDHGFRIVVADPAGDVSYRRACYVPRAAIVVGNERLGVHPFWREAADEVVSIPMLGVADSLNVGHAAALLLYEAHYQQLG
jgi:RNA methyltransferase, TrmH family